MRLPPSAFASFTAPPPCDRNSCSSFARCPGLIDTPARGPVAR